MSNYDNYAVGDLVKVVRVDSLDQGMVALGGVYIVTDVDIDGWPRVDCGSDRYYMLTPSQVELIENDEEYSFDEIIKMLIDKTLDSGDSIESKSKKFMVERSFSGVGLMEKGSNSPTVSAKIQSSDINEMWKVIKKDTKVNMSLADIEEKLGYEINITD